MGDCTLTSLSFGTGINDKGSYKQEGLNTWKKKT